VITSGTGLYAGATGAAHIEMLSYEDFCGFDPQHGFTYCVTEGTVSGTFTVPS
jgi:hypothetical protein